MRTLRLALTFVFFASFASQALATNQHLPEDDGKLVLLSAADQQKLSEGEEILQAQLLRDSFVFIPFVKETNQPKADDGGNQLLLRAAARRELSARSEALKAELEELQAQLLSDQAAEKNVRAAGGQKRVRTPNLLHANVHICSTIDGLKQAKDRLKRAEKSLVPLMHTHIYDLPRDVLWLVFERTRFLDQLKFPQVCRLFKAVSNMAYVHPVYGPLVSHRFIYLVKNAVDSEWCAKIFPKDKLADEFDLHTMKGKIKFVEAYGLIESSPLCTSACVGQKCTFKNRHPRVLSLIGGIYLPTRKNPTLTGNLERLNEFLADAGRDFDFYMRNEKSIMQALTLHKIYDMQYHRQLIKMRKMGTAAEEIFIKQDDKLPLSHVSFESRLFTNLRSVTIKARLRTVSPSISQLSQLRELDLSFNRLTAFPVEFWSLTQLEKLLLDHNSIDFLPEALGSFTNLKALALQGNRLRALPAGIGRLTKLWGTLDLSNNELEEVPTEMVYLKSITSLYLAENLFTTFPTNICTMTNLTDIDLSDNKLGSYDDNTHEVPDEIGRLLNLQSLRMPGCVRNGVSPCITLLTKLVYLDIREWLSIALRHYDDAEIRSFISWYANLKKAGCRIIGGNKFLMDYVRRIVTGIAVDLTNFLQERKITRVSHEAIAETRTSE